MNKLLTLEEVFVLADLVDDRRRKNDTAQAVATILNNHGMMGNAPAILMGMDRLVLNKLIEPNEGKYQITPKGEQALKDAYSKLHMLMLTLQSKML